LELATIFDKLCENTFHVTFTKNILLIALAIICCHGAISQEALQTVVAKNGDGIFSILRDEGIEIAKYYETFLELNQDKLINGSDLVVGETYYIPNAPDSFKNRGLIINVSDGDERPIFERELAYLKLKDNSLANTVYYLMEHNSVNKKVISNNVNDGITVTMARKLLQSGARVYLLDSNPKDSLNLIDYVGIVNKKYLRHNGDYQRLMVIDNGGIATRAKTDITVYHYAESEESKRFADNILRVFSKKTVKREALNDYSEMCTDFEDITFAKNSLPPITFIIMGSKSVADNKTLQVNANKNSIANLITNGILSDYSSTEFEDN
jgi:N-acetylmuramoyl-L-alanine amidase